MASFGRHAFYFGQRISFEARRALARGPVIFRYADGIDSARIFLANVETSMGETVAELMSGAVDVINAGYRFAAQSRIVRIAGIKSRRTLTSGHVIVDQANGVRPARDGFTGRSASRRSGFVEKAASFVLGTLSVGGATVFREGFTTASVVGIAREVRKALTAPFVTRGNANGVGRAGEIRANGGAFQDSQSVRFASRRGRAIVVPRAIGQRRFFAKRFYRIPNVALLTIAYRMSVFVDGANFVCSASDGTAGIDASFVTVYAGSAYQPGGTVFVSFAFFSRNQSFWAATVN